jgi:predicted adenine nucleotide alpha hydrolase (AANH) superfamily ATPase
MTDINYSREYLRGIPGKLKQKRKQDLIRVMVGSVGNPVTVAATKEKTSYMIDEQVYAKYQVPPHPQEFQHLETYLRDVVLTKEEILYALQEKFPGCVVSFQETWVDAEDNTRVLKKGILIDWS